MANLPDYPVICDNTIAECRVEVYEDMASRDRNQRFHYQMRGVGMKNSNRNPALCGASILDMRKAAWFDVGDKRGKVHFLNACEECRGKLVF